MTTDADALVVELQARLATFERQVLQAANKNDAALARIEKKFAGTQRMLNKGLMFNSAALDRGLQNARRSLDSFAGRAPVVGGLIDGMGTKATIAAAGVAALGAALMVAGQAMSFADEIADSAAKAQVGVEALQELRYAAVASGSEIKDADEALQGLSATLGKAIAGEARALKWFKAIGFDREQLRSLGDAETLLPIIADKIAALGTAAERAALAEKLGVKPLLPLLEQGSAGMAKLTEEARRLGVVMDTQTVKELGEAHDKVKALALVTKVNLYSALADLAPVLVWITGLVAGLSRSIREALDAFRRLEDKSTSTIESSIGQIDAQLRRVASDGRIDPSERTAMEGWKRERDRLKAELARRAGRGVSLGPTPGGDALDVSKPGGSSSRGRDAEAERRRKEEEERARALRAAEELYRARLDELRATQGAFNTEVERLAVQGAILAAEQEHEREALERQRIAGDITQAEYEQRRAVLEKTQDLERQNQEDLEREARLKAEGDQLEQLADWNAQVLRMAAERAETWQERRKIEQQLLEIAQQQRRVDQEHLLRTGQITQAEFDARMAGLAALEHAEDRALLDGTAGPLERASREFRLTTDELEELAVEGVRGLGNAAVDVLLRTKSASEAIKELWASLLRDIMSKLAEQYISKPAGDFLGQIFNGALGFLTGGSGMTHEGVHGPGFAKGGRPPLGRISKVGEFGAEAFVPDVPGTILPNGLTRRIEAMTAGAPARPSAVVNVNFAPVINAPNADAEGLREVKAHIARMEAELPGKVKSTVQEGLDRGQIKPRR